MQVLDVGCGTFPYQPREGEAVVGVDFREYVKPTIVHDLNNFPYPLDDNMFDKVYASHVMEHLTDHIRFMEEIYRVSKSNAEIIIRVPHFSGRSAWCDPTHLRAYSYY
ncbi:MAG TPA: class I SAM-dependent methyltransferase [Anaerohalosphaeraceae bacterium]|nr:class I SAM-dependent methyltransferase [Anaerohalosphaeraceae bacterium]HRT49356.1 class I SAM-dependent methyltransferase [Anaerohalosphaeraceae bacterium]HRT85915.1 class I SAM-dependent methyltransferase [Anaerohalosphaeraceae bacterium]